MIIAIVLITIGHSRSKKAALPEGKHKAIAIFYTVALVIIIVTIILSKRGLCRHDALIWNGYKLPIP